MSSEAVRIYLARTVSPADGPRFEARDEEADLRIRWVPLSEAVAAVLAGRLHNPMAVMGLLAAERLLHPGGSATTLAATPRHGDTPWPDMSTYLGSARSATS
jgi:ADP-ribose pyrophosphatase